MRYSLFLILICTFFLTAPLKAQLFDLQGHRGARGMYPENSIPAFIYAIDQGVTTLELDVVISADGKVVVSHEPWMNPEICLAPDGSELDKDGSAYNIYVMTYAEISRYDCGSMGNRRFPEQNRVTTNKPLLSDMISTVERYMKGNTGYEFDYNIEIKSSESGDGVFHPAPAEFSELVHDVIDQYLPWDRVVIQSFDFRVLQYWNKTYPDVRLAALVENVRSIETNLGSLGFTPHIYSPNYMLLNKKKIEELHERGIKVIPWTVNDTDKMIELKKWGVDGLITDYPNKAREVGLTLQFDKD
ncbi:MAG: glycerophosphodiester phosphodiesterase family protein [Cyclobacteriaceae bacterium]